jgi:SAM-dependent methyltransferase
LPAEPTIRACEHPAEAGDGGSSSYRDSHNSPGYSQCYERTFEQGYYAHLWREVERPLVSAILADLAGRGATRSLDFACGTGRILQLHLDHFDDVIGNDISAEMLGTAREKCPTSRIVHADLTASGSDHGIHGRQVCTAFRFFLNAEPQLRADAAKAIHGCLDPGGHLVANFHVNARSPVGRLYRLRNWMTGRTINNVMSEQDAVTLLSAHGFDVEAVHWYGLWPRFGWRFDRLNRLMIARSEALARRMPSLRRHAQIFIIVARRR